MIFKLFTLSLAGAWNPKLLAMDLLLVQNRRARAMFVCLLIGFMIVALTFGLVDVLVVRADALKAQGSLSAGLDLTLGVLLLAVGALVATGRLHGRRRAAVPPRGGQPKKKHDWAQRVLTEPRLGLALLLGAVIGTPGASYLAALHILVSQKPATAIQISTVVVFVIIEAALLIIPLAFLVFWPEATKRMVKQIEDWLLGHARQLIAAITLILGAYLVVHALVRLS